MFISEINLISSDQSPYFLEMFTNNNILTNKKRKCFYRYFPKVFLVDLKQLSFSEVPSSRGIFLYCLYLKIYLACLF